MENLPIDEKESGVNAIVGFESEKEKEFLDHFKNKFENNFPDPKERQKTVEEIGMIDRLNEGLYDFLGRYGIESIEIPAANIHALDKSKFSPEELEKFQKKFGTDNGYYSAAKQGIAILKDYGEGKLSYLQTLAHEMLHLQGFYSYQKSSPEAADFTLKKGGDSAHLNIRRSGFSIGTMDGKRLLFHKLNESVITELAIRFEKDYFVEWKELEDDLKKRDEYIRQVAERDHAPIDKVRETVASIKGDKASGYKWVSYSYHDDRKHFNSLVDQLYEKNKPEFRSREDVFSLFAKATMTGRIMTVARLLEKTFGKGSFRDVGERSADKKA